MSAAFRAELERMKALERELRIAEAKRAKSAEYLAWQAVEALDKKEQLGDIWSHHYRRDVERHKKATAAIAAFMAGRIASEERAA